ncbi:hypothetical protein RRG08_059867 [Elysia crispata]|uniref:Uncharacterized protein n=1 Tax=Elysia crispata TaxID=231223 RepID=A0AAE1B2D1_9GAST|nr:hypothetical protein RRG08_059867 [Elysia crispata]
MTYLLPANCGALVAACSMSSLSDISVARHLWCLAAAYFVSNFLSDISVALHLWCSGGRVLYVKLVWHICCPPLVVLWWPRALCQACLTYLLPATCGALVAACSMSSLSDISVALHLWYSGGRVLYVKLVWHICCPPLVVLWWQHALCEACLAYLLPGTRGALVAACSM